MAAVGIAWERGEQRAKNRHHLKLGAASNASKVGRSKQRPYERKRSKQRPYERKRSTQRPYERKEAFL